MEKSTSTLRREMLIFALLAVLLWATNYVIVRFLVPYLNPIMQTTLRYATTAILAFIMGIVQKISLPKKKDLPLLILMSLMGYSLFSLIMVMGARTVTASVSSFMLALTPVLASLFALMFLREHMSKLKWIALAISATGVSFLLFSDKNFHIDSNLLLVLLGAIMFAIYTILQRVALRTYRTKELSVYAFVISGITIIPLLPDCASTLPHIEAIGIIMVIVLGITTLLSMIFWTSALRRASHVGAVSNFMFLTPILTTIIAIFAMGEYPPTTTYFGGTFMLIGLLLSNFTPKNERTTKQATPTPKS